MHSGFFSESLQFIPCTGDSKTGTSQGFLWGDQTQRPNNTLSAGYNPSAYTDHSEPAHVCLGSRYHIKSWHLSTEKTSFRQPRFPGHTAPSHGRVLHPSVVPLDTIKCTLLAFAEFTWRSVSAVRRCQFCWRTGRYRLAGVFPQQKVWSWVRKES